jgi:hypothetical protein
MTSVDNDKKLLLTTMYARMPRLRKDRKKTGKYVSAPDDGE